MTTHAATNASTTTQRGAPAHASPHSPTHQESVLIRIPARLTLFAMLVLFASVASASTAPGTPVPEPGMLELLGIGAAIAIAIVLRGRK